MHLQNQQLQSSALKANLARTAASVKIPEHYHVLLDSVADYYGVHKRVEDLLIELHHPYINYDYVVENLKAFAINDFHKINRFERADAAIECIFAIFFTVVEAEISETVRDRALKFMLDFADTVVSESSEQRQGNLQILNRMFSRLVTVASERGFSLKKCSSHARSLFLQLGEELSTLTGLFSLVSAAFKDNYHYWLSVDDPLSWYDHQERAGLSGSGAQEGGAAVEVLRRLVIPLSHANLRKVFLPLSKTDFSQQSFVEIKKQLSSVPDYTKILNAYLLIADQIEKEPDLASYSYLSKLDFMFNILATPALEEIHGLALQEVNRLLSLGFREEPAAQRPAFVEKIVQSLCKISQQARFRSIINNCMLTLAREIVNSSDRQLFDKLQEGLITAGFQYPDVTGSNAEWQVQVNPDHIKNIRT